MRAKIWIADIPLGRTHTLLNRMHMKERLTLTVDAPLAAQARRVAHQRGISVSRLMEGALRASLADYPRRSGSFSDRWSGRFTVVDDDPKDLRRAALKERHHLA